MGMGEQLAERLLRDIGQPQEEPEDMTPLQAEAQAELLKECFADHKQKHSFSPGDLVRWKSRMSNRRIPVNGAPAIVIRVLDKPVIDRSKDASGTPYFNEGLDIVLGVIDRDGDFVTYHFSSQLFEPWEG